MHYQIDGTSVRLVGTLHMLPDGVTSLPTWVENAYAWADKICIEHLPPEMLGCIQLHAPHKLPDLVSPLLWQSLRQEWSSGSGLPVLETLKPWAAMIFLAVHRLGPLAPGVEAVLFAREEARGRLIDRLESGVEVAQLWDEAPPEIWVDALQRMPSVAEQRRVFLEMYAAWLDCSTEKLAAVRPPGGVEMSEGLQRLMFHVRNERWAQRIAGHDFGAQRTLILVGGLHLFKERNLIECLAEQGLTCSPVGLNAG